MSNRKSFYKLEEENNKTKRFITLKNNSDKLPKNKRIAITYRKKLNIIKNTDTNGKTIYSFSPVDETNTPDVSAEIIDTPIINSIFTIEQIKKIVYDTTTLFIEDIKNLINKYSVNNDSINLLTDKTTIYNNFNASFNTSMESLKKLLLNNNSHNNTENTNIIKKNLKDIINKLKTSTNKFIEQNNNINIQDILETYLYKQYHGAVNIDIDNEKMNNVSSYINYLILHIDYLRHYIYITRLKYDNELKTRKLLIHIHDFISNKLKNNIVEGIINNDKSKKYTRLYNFINECEELITFLNNNINNIQIITDNIHNNKIIVTTNNNQKELKIITNPTNNPAYSYYLDYKKVVEHYIKSNKSTTEYNRIMNTTDAFIVSLYNKISLYGVKEINSIIDDIVKHIQSSIKSEIDIKEYTNFKNYIKEYHKLKSDIEKNIYELDNQGNLIKIQTTDNTHIEYKTKKQHITLNLRTYFNNEHNFITKSTTDNNSLKDELYNVKIRDTNDIRCTGKGYQHICNEYFYKKYVYNIFHTLDDNSNILHSKKILNYINFLIDSKSLLDKDTNSMYHDIIHTSNKYITLFRNKLLPIH